MLLNVKTANAMCPCHRIYTTRGCTAGACLPSGSVQPDALSDGELQTSGGVCPGSAIVLIGDTNHFILHELIHVS